VVVYAARTFFVTEGFCNGKEAKDGVRISATVRAARRGAVEKKIASDPELEQNLKAVLEVRTAGDPDKEDALWTDLSPRQIGEKVADQGTPVSPPVVQDWIATLQ